MNGKVTQSEIVTDEIPATGSALRLVLIYAGFAVLWILVSDRAVGWLFKTPEQILLVQTFKGWLFVALTALLLFGLISRLLNQQSRLYRRQQEAHSDRRRVQELLAAIADGSTDAIFAKDLDGRYLLCNREMRRLFCRAAESPAGDAPVPIDAHERRVIDDNRVHTYEEVLATVDGQRTYLSTKGPLHDGDGRIVGLFGVSRDITERLQVHQALQASEQCARLRAEELAKLIDAVPAAVWVAHDTEAMVITGNRLSYGWLQLPEGTNVSQSVAAEQRPGEFEIRRDGEVLAPADMPLQLAASGQEIRDCEFSFVYPDGRRRDVLGNAMPLLDEHGRARGAISAFVDITARRAAEQAMQAAKAEAERANNDKSCFLAAASHDLRQPLAALSLYVTVLGDKVAAADRPLLAKTRECVGSLSELLNDLLDMSKLDAGVVAPNVSDFALGEVLDSLQSIHAPEAQLKGLRLRCRPSGLVGRTDPVLFKRIVGNFVDNAVRYTERGGVVVGCRRRRGKTWVEVWDTGAGIPADQQSVIFEAFKQLDCAARTRGSGLGLAIAAKSAALLGLELKIRSSPGQGSMFAIELPLGQAAPSPLPKPAGAACRVLRVALVDDNTMVRQALTLALQDFGHQVVAAAGGDELLAALGGQPPDIVLSDYRLGHGETGYDVVLALRARLGEALPAMLITGDTDPKMIRSMADRGIVVLHKPLELEELQAYLEDLTWPPANL